MTPTAMTPERWDRVQDLFVQALDIPAGERRTFLEQACGTDAELRSEVESLLRHDEPAAPLLTALSPVAAGVEGRRIGPYRVIRLLGRGGMGAVYLAARDDDQYRKQVAIKLLNRGMDTDAMLQRFRQERQILANLEHPFIARLVDGGATEDGLPYFVMEYVDGLPITKYCDEKDLPIDARVSLFRLVCEAVQYAHQSLVVHCDLKPGNILITKEGIPKLLDFGIAKVINPVSGEPQTVTLREQRLMTPEYASPEQVMGSPISTSMDIYSLGIVLYEVLTHQRPHRFTTSSLADIERRICQEEPPRPSAVSANRGLMGDLDAIVLTAMRKDASRRYASAAEVSEDLRRHAEGLPVVAQEDRWTYRSAKFIGRHRLGVIGAGLIVLSLIGGIVATTYQAKRAERRFLLVRQLANTMMGDLYGQVARLSGSTGAQMSMVRTVVTYLDALAADAGSDPELDLEIGRAYARVAGVEGHPSQTNLGQTRLAESHYRKALALIAPLTDNPDLRPAAMLLETTARLEFSEVLEALGRADASHEQLSRAAQLVDLARSEGREPGVSTQVSLFTLLARHAGQSGDWQKEQQFVRRVVEFAEKTNASSPSSENLDSLRTSYLNLAEAYSHGGDLDHAREFFEKALRVAQQQIVRGDLGYSQRYAIAGIHHLYGDMLGAPDDPNLGDPAGALAQYREAARLNEERTIADPKDVNARRNLAGSYRRIGIVQLETKPTESLIYYRKAVALSRVISESEPANVSARSALADGMLGEATALHLLGRNQEAIPMLRRVLEMQHSIENADPGHIFWLRSTSRAYLVLGNALASAADEAAALESYRQGLTAAERSISNAPSSTYMMLDRADLLEAMGRLKTVQAERAKGEARVAPLAEARAAFADSLNIWKDWAQRQLAVSYAAKRERRAQAALAAIPRN